jgi:pyruvate kinase
MPKIPQSSFERTHARRLVVTLGPSSTGKEAELASSGATHFRLNASHLNLERLSEYIASAQSRAPQVEIIVDLQGAKMRLGDFEPRVVSVGQCVSFVLAEATSTEQVPLPHSEPYAVLMPDDVISLDDGRLSATVQSVHSNRIEVRMQSEGQLRPRKGFNRAVHPVALDSLTARDIEIIKVAHAAGCRCFAVSFVGDGRECEWVRQQVTPVEVIAKIERQDALTQIDRIARCSDTLWICRGDLGAQLGSAALGRSVAKIAPGSFAVPVLMAGQVFEHLTEHRSPTRSEICHLYDLLDRGYAGIVLSDETAIGCDPVNAVRVARELVDAFVLESSP